MISDRNQRLIGYARVSTIEQELNLQIDALLAHGVRKERLFCDKISGAREDRPGLIACNEALRPKDTLVVWRLDRLGRSMCHLVNMIEDLKERGIGFRSISDGMIDTTSASGELVREKRLEHDPLLHVPMRKVDTDIRHDRPALTDEEFLKLVEAARKSDKSVEGMTGLERSFLYTMARMTGLRRIELASLTAASFVFGDDSFLIVEAGYSKHRERDVVPLHPDLVPLIQEQIRHLRNGDPLLPLLEQRKTAQMIQVDLEAAGIPYRDADGLYADFHALRHSFISGAWESGETPDVVMSLARHRSLQMTMRYTHVDRSAQVRAVKAMRSPLRKDGPR